MKEILRKLRERYMSLNLVIRLYNNSIKVEFGSYEKDFTTWKDVKKYLKEFI
jgi:hypothetical protein